VIKAVMTSVGTESLMADNFAKRTGNSGKLEGAYKKVVRWPLLNPERLGATVTGEDMLGHSVIGTILGSAYPAPEDELTQIDYERQRPRAAAVGGIYKARPLNGVWATAPYLHNGSVPSLYQLLLPARDRRKTFTVGSRQFDPKNVGFRTDAPGFYRFQTRNEEDAQVAGNSNEGHEYGQELTDEERWQLVEYLKSL
jgi:hypothetical protein